MRIHHRALLVSVSLAAGVAACGDDRVSSPAAPTPLPQATVVTSSGNIKVRALLGDPSNGGMAGLSQCIVCVYGAIGAVAIPSF